MTACPLIGNREVDSVYGRNINTIENAPGTQARERVGGRFVESAGERERGLALKRPTWVEESTMKDEEKMETGEAGSSRQLLIGGPRASATSTRKQGKARQRDVRVESTAAKGKQAVSGPRAV